MPVQPSRGLDAIDLKILAALQRDGRMTIQELSDSVGLSARPCLERVRRLRKSGIITSFRAVIDLELLSKPVVIFCEIALASQAHSERIEAVLKATDEAVESWEISGSFDYLVQFVCPGLERYQALTARFIDDPTLGIARIVSHIVLRPVRRFAGYPASLLGPRTAEK